MSYLRLLRDSRFSAIPRLGILRHSFVLKKPKRKCLILCVNKRQVTVLEKLIPRGKQTQRGFKSNDLKPLLVRIGTAAQIYIYSSISISKNSKESK